MKTQESSILLLLADGVDEEESIAICRYLRHSVQLTLTSPRDYLSVETVSGNQRGADILVDQPLPQLYLDHFDGLVIPKGLLAAEELEHNHFAIACLDHFLTRQKLVMLSGEAERLAEKFEPYSLNLLLRANLDLNQWLDIGLTWLESIHGSDFKSALIVRAEKLR